MHVKKGYVGPNIFWFIQKRTLNPFNTFFDFQQDTVYVKEILDAEGITHFDLRFSQLKSKWDGLVQSVHPDRYMNGYLRMKQLL